MGCLCSDFLFQLHNYEVHSSTAIFLVSANRPPLARVNVRRCHPWCMYQDEREHLPDREHSDKCACWDIDSSETLTVTEMRNLDRANGSEFVANSRKNTFLTLSPNSKYSNSF